MTVGGREGRERNGGRERGGVIESLLEVIDVWLTGLRCNVVVQLLGEKPAAEETHNKNQTTMKCVCVCKHYYA